MLFFFCFFFLALTQILTDELVKEVENSIAEFKRHNQEYDEERVKGQVTNHYSFTNASFFCFFLFLFSLLCAMYLLVLMNRLVIDNLLSIRLLLPFPIFG